MASFERIEVRARPEGGFVVIIDDKFDDCLARDEALGVVAAALFNSSIPYLHSYEEWSRRQLRWHGDEHPQPVAMLEDKRVLSKANTRLWPKEFLKTVLAATNLGRGKAS